MFEVANLFVCGNIAKRVLFLILYIRIVFWTRGEFISFTTQNLLCSKQRKGNSLFG